MKGLGVVNVKLLHFTGDGNRLMNPGDPYSKISPAYGKFGFYCEACVDVLIKGVGMVSYPGYGFDPHGVKNTDIPSKNLVIDSCYAL
jgi:hypothetical protein